MYSNVGAMSSALETQESKGRNRIIQGTEEEQRMLLTDPGPQEAPCRKQWSGFLREMERWAGRSPLRRQEPL